LKQDPADGFGHMSCCVRCLVALLATAWCSPALAGALTNPDIIAELRGGLSESVVLLSIEANECAFDLAPDQLIALRQQGVGPAIIHAMLDAARKREEADRTFTRPPEGRAASTRGRGFPSFPLEFFGAQFASSGGPRVLRGVLFVGAGRLRFDGTDSNVILVEPSSLTGYLLPKAGPARSVNGFQGIRGAASQVGLSPYWLPVDPQNPCAEWLGVVCEPLGAGEVEGRPATRWALKHFAENESWTSYAWVDVRLHIVSRLEFEGHITELRDIVEVSQPASLFRTP
jgi:hypothetical protein